jgi:hypothetical protein
LASAGGVFLWLALEDKRAVEEAPKGTVFRGEIEERYGRVQSRSTIGFVLAGVGVAALGGGLAWGVLGGDGGVALVPAPGGAVALAQF